MFLLLKNWLCLSLTSGRIGDPYQEKSRKHLRGMVALALVYWIAACLPFCLGWNVMTAFFPASLIAALLTGLYNLTLRRQVVEQNIVFNKRRCAVLFSGAFLFFGFQIFGEIPGIPSHI